MNHSTNIELTRRIDALDRTLKEIRDEFRRRFPGNGVWENPSNRIRGNISVSMSDLAKKRDLEDYALTSDLDREISNHTHDDRYDTENEINKYLGLYLLADGTRELTGNWDAGDYRITAETFESDVVTGTAPIVVASTTLVSNLNADLLDNQEGSYYLDYNNLTNVPSTFAPSAHASSHESGGSDAVNHGSLTGFVGNEHIDHSTVSVSGGGILSGGGTIAANRTITLAHGDVDHNQTTNYVAGEHVAHSGVSVIAGTGMSGGGTIDGDVTLNCTITQYTDEAVRDVVATFIQNATGITWTHDDPGDTLTPAIDHDALPNFVGNKHIDHTSVTLTAGNGLSGGGDISANRSFILDLNELGIETAIAASDYIAMVDVTDNGSQKITFANFEGAIDHGSISGNNDDDHTQYALLAGRASQQVLYGGVN
ncbi:hypothetical protein GF352_05110, partial [archaeon]|nr:hypothetical protein [archaeon]